MFGNANTRDASASAGAARTGTRRHIALSVIAADVTLVGNLTTDGDFHLDGAIEGDITCGSLVQGPSGRVIGKIVAHTARLAGTIEGEVSAGTLTIERTARIRGDVSYDALTIETGGQIDGRMNHRSAEAAAAPEVPLQLVDQSAA